MSSEIDYTRLFFREKEEKERLADLVLRQSSNISNLIDLLRSGGERHDVLFTQYNELRTLYNELADEIADEINNEEENDDNVSTTSTSTTNSIEIIVDDDNVNPYDPQNITFNINDDSITLQNISIAPRQLHLIKRHFHEDTICPICLDNINKEDLAIPHCNCNTPFHALCFSQFLTHGIRKITEYRIMMGAEYDDDDPEINCPMCRYNFHQ